MRSAPHRRLSLAICLIKSTVSWEILGVRKAARDLYFQKSLKPRRCHREPRLRLDNEQRLLPGASDPGQQHQEYAIRLGTGRSFHLSPKNNELLTQQCVFCDEFGLVSGKVSQRPQQQRGGVGFGPGDVAAVERLKAKTCHSRHEGQYPLHSVHSLL
jgi:hypothetical protein